MNFLTIFSLLFLVTTVKSQQNQVCLTMSMQVEGQSHALGQGPPGRRGPLGPPGPKGDSGFPGQCVCDPSEINKLQEEMRNIRDSINVLMSRSHTHTDKVAYCLAGLKSGRVPNGAITSEGFAHGGMEPYRGRLDNTQRSDQHGAWAAAHPLKVGDWTQVDFKTPTFITGIVTQGRPQAGPQWVTSYKISYGNSTKQMRVIQENGSDLIFQGNRDRDTKVVNMFPHPLSARYFRLLAQTWNTHITIRLDYLTC
ncbi:lactadherin-like isoform X2 [Clavelina lepadiformis]|uniref:lactadherin-like isoform X2 n=1 Tax=Clavelina lepadiformis TaxID=159417 RepID=UPI004040F1BF